MDTDFSVAQTVKNLPVTRETRVWSLSWEVPLEKGMAIHSSILAWRIPWTEKPGGLQSAGLKRVRHDWATHTHTQVWMWELDSKEGWMLKNWCLQIMVLGKTLESPLDSKEIQPVNSEWNHLWIFIGRTAAEVSILWPPDVRSQPIGKDPDAGKDWGQEKKWVTEDEMVGWYHQLNGYEFEQTPGYHGRQGSLGWLQFMELQRVELSY